MAHNWSDEPTPADTAMVDNKVAQIQTDMMNHPKLRAAYDHFIKAVVEGDRSNPITRSLIDTLGNDVVVHDNGNITLTLTVAGVTALSEELDNLAKAIGMLHVLQQIGMPEELAKNLVHKMMHGKNPDDQT